MLLQYISMKLTDKNNNHLNYELTKQQQTNKQTDQA